MKTSTFKKAPQKTLRVLDPIRTSPFMVPTRKAAPTGNAPMRATPLKAVTNRFPQAGGNRISEAPGVVFTPQPLMAVGVLFSPMVSGWSGGRAGGRAAGNSLSGLYLRNRKV